jgi:hypothetical protein
VYESDTQFVRLEAFPAWCLTMGPGPKDLDRLNRPDQYLYLAPCSDDSGYYDEYMAEDERRDPNRVYPYPLDSSQRWEVPIAEPEEEEFVEEEEESEDDGPTLNKDGDLGSKKRGKN